MKPTKSAKSGNVAMGFEQHHETRTLSDKEKIMSVLAFLQGYLVTDKLQPPKMGYIEEEGKLKEVEIPNINGIAYVATSQEKEARQYLAEMLRSGKPLDRHISNSLADLFDIKPQNDMEPRTLVFKFRSRGKRQNQWIKTRIASHVFELENNGDKVESAISSAMAEFGISRSEVNRIRKQYRPVYVALGKLTK